MICLKDLMLFTFAAIVCALASLLYFVSDYINYRLIINIWLIALPLFILLYVILRCHRGDRIKGGENLPVKDRLWDKYLVLASFKDYLKGLKFVNSKLFEQGEELPIITEENAEILYVDVVAAQGKLKEVFSVEAKTEFTEALFAYYGYVNIRFAAEKMEEVKDIIINLPQVETEVKLLIVKSFTNISNINQEFSFIEKTNMLATFNQSCYENYQVKQFYLVDGFIDWLEGLLADMEKQLVNAKE